ncbi:MAG: DUF2878 domain-containing protein [Phycisphaerae bacterium]|nr:DUF2878 domain-containing protein [Phycisphaerae bacterium]
MGSDKIIQPQWIGGYSKGLWNFISVNVGWMACVLGAARGYHWLGGVVVTSLFVIHILVIDRHNMSKIFIVAFATMVIGFFVDTALILLGAIEPNRWLIPAPLTTLWDIAIWANFSLALNSSLRFLQEKPLVAAVLGAIFAPGTYYAGAGLGALHISEPHFVSLLWVGGAWFFVMPCLSHIARRFYQPGLPSQKSFFGFKIDL